MTAPLPTEKERRFLIDRLNLPLDLAKYPAKDITQSYLPHGEGSPLAYHVVAFKGGILFSAWKGDDLLTSIEFPPEKAQTLSRLPGTKYIGQKDFLRLPENAILRARRFGDEGVLTIKIYEGGKTLEFEGIMTARAADRLAIHRTNGLDKQRYDVPGRGDYMIELDVFTGNLAGLVIAEIEQKEGKPDIDHVALPDWLGPEVTPDPDFSNASLAKNGAPWGKIHTLLQGSMPVPASPKL